MQSRYNVQWLTNRFEKGEHLKFIYFWGYTNKSNDEVGKFCFSQWFESPFEVGGTVYKTAEH